MLLTCKEVRQRRRINNHISKHRYLLKITFSQQDDIHTIDTKLKNNSKSTHFFYLQRFFHGILCYETKKLRNT